MTWAQLSKEITYPVSNNSMKDLFCTVNTEMY